MASTGLGGTDLLALVSAAGLLALGLLLLRLGRRSGPPLFLGIFATLWGGQLLLIRLAILDRQSGLFQPLAETSIALGIPLYFFLAHFAATFPHRLGWADHRAWPFVLALPAAATLGVLMLEPQAILSPGTDSVWGWAVFLLVFVPLYGSHLFALARFANAFLSSDATIRRQQALFGTLAFLGYVLYAGTAFLTGISPDVQARLGPLGLAIYAGALGSGVILGLSIVVRLSRSHVGRPYRRVLVALAVLPVASGVMFSTAADILGLWRLVEVVLLGYAVAKFELFDLDLRLRRAVRPITVAGLGLAAWGVLAAVPATVWDIGTGSNALAFGALGIAGGAFALAVSPRLQRFLDGRFPYLRATEEYLLRRKLEVYRAALESGSTEKQVSGLAKDLGLKPRERALLDRAFAVSNGNGKTAHGGELLAGRYRIERALAEGTHGRVLLAWDDRLHERVVLKEHVGFGGWTASAAFAREAAVLGKVQHRNVIALRDVFRVDDDLFLALEYAPDGSLEERLRARGAFPLEEALDVAAQVLAGLAEAHRKGMVHRDVKPANILFKGSTVKLADFGIAASEVLDKAVRAMQGGTLGWMAPEQARGERANAASDTYAAGAILYRMLAGQHYLGLDSLGEQAARRAIVAKEPALPLAGVPDEANAILARALSKDPARRFPDGEAMLKEVQRARRRAARAVAARA